MFTEKLKDSHWHPIIIGVCGRSFRPPSRILISIISTMPSFVSTSMNVVKRTFSLPCRKPIPASSRSYIHIYQSLSHTLTFVCFKSFLARILFMPRFRIKSSNQLVYLCLFEENDHAYKRWEEECMLVGGSSMDDEEGIHCM